jgi:membrane protease subunit HflK
MPAHHSAHAGPWSAPGDAPDGGGADATPGGDDGELPWGERSRRPRLPPSGEGGGPGRGPPPPHGGPDLDDLLRQLRDRFGSRFAGPGGLRPGMIWAALAVIGLGWVMSGVYVVQPDQQAVVMRFGRYVGDTGPGLNYHLPIPIEHAEKVSVTNLNRLDIGGSPGADVPEESLMLTGDENIIDLNFSVQWRVADAGKYLFRLSDPDAAVKMVAESAMREVVGKTALQTIMTTARGEVQRQAAELMQRILDGYGSGVSVVEVQIRGANPPREVIPAFREVNNATQDAQTAVNEAEAYRNKVINEAKGDAARITQAAEGYRARIVAEADGEASRFVAVEAEYRRAPGVTRQRLYTETMERVLARSRKTVVDTPKGGTAPIVLPPGLLRPDAPEPAAPGSNR